MLTESASSHSSLKPPAQSGVRASRALVQPLDVCLAPTRRSAVHNNESNSPGSCSGYVVERRDTGAVLTFPVNDVIVVVDVRRGFDSREGHVPQRDHGRNKAFDDRVRLPVSSGVNIGDVTRDPTGRFKGTPRTLGDA